MLLSKGLIRRKLLAVDVGVALVQLGNLLGGYLFRLSDLQRVPYGARHIFDHHRRFDCGLGAGANGEDAVLLEQHGHRLTDGLHDHAPDVLLADEDEAATDDNYVTIPSGPWRTPIEKPTVSISDHFADLEDPRSDRTKLHKLFDIITVAICAVICGADSWVEIEEFGNAKIDWFRTFLELANSIPSHDTFGRVFALLDPDQFRSGFVSWIQAISRITEGEIVAFDGKTLRRSHDNSLGKAAIHMVSAWASTNRLVLGQLKVDEK